MKNKNLWLTFLIFTGAIFLLTWVIPSTSYDDAGALALGTIKPTGIWDVFYYLSMLLSWFGENFILVIAIGIFYGIINKTGALRTLVDKIAKKVKNHEKLFIMLCSSLFLLVAGLTGIDIALLSFLPLVAGVILTLGYSKLICLMATVVPTAVGVMGSLYATTLFSPISSYIDSGLSFGWYKVALMIAGLVAINLYLFFTAKLTKGKEKEEINDEMLFIEKTEGPKKLKLWPIITVFSVIFGLYILGLTPWSKIYNLTLFSDIHTAVMNFSIGSFTISKSILGSSLAAFGEWSVSDATALLLLASIVLILIYRVKWEEAYKGAISGITKILPIAILVLLSNIVFVLASQSGILNTIINTIANITSGINVFTYSFASFIGACLSNEGYITSYITGILSTVVGDTANLSLLLFIQQVMYGIAMLVAPTSIMLLVGLSYLEVGYTTWMKYIWKFLLILTTVGLVALSLAIIL
ncbi:MAG: hypothetical protein WC343_12750 [Bacilli bacterium]|jgi:uncharacterized ion transporter superfamily protein YfcC